MKKRSAYLAAGLDRLMAAILLQAIRDVFSINQITREDSRLWLRKHGADYVSNHHFGFPNSLFEDWIRKDFYMSKNKISYLRKSRAKGD